jgi:UrcA family protein
MRITGKVLMATAVSVAGLARAVAHADSPPSVGFERSSLVRYNDLDLNRPKDVATLYRRITGSADKVCGPSSLTGIHYKWAEYTSCYNDTVAQTVARINHPSLSAYFQQQSPQPVAREMSIARQ